MLNGADPHTPAQTFQIAERGPASTPQELQHMDQYLQNTFPRGATPLTRHLVHIRQAIASMVPQIQGNRRICLVIMTDGLPSSEHNEQQLQVPEFMQALRSFENLPVWIVVRLCTDDEKVFDFYNTLDAQVNLPYDVLDDLVGEALEVYLHNPWLTYGLPLHRMREMGFPHTVMDALDEHALTLPELWSLCGLLFANHRIPNPAVDWIAFLRGLVAALAQERQQWNPVTKQRTPWIDLARLHTIYARHVPVPPDLTYAIPTSTLFPPGYKQQGVQPQNPFQQQQSAHSVPYNTTKAQGETAFSQQSKATHAPQRQGGAPSSPHPSPVTASTSSVQTSGDRTTIIKQSILQQWALQPPALQNLRPIGGLLASIQTTFPPAFGVAKHSYFEKFKPMAPDALESGDAAVLKRGMLPILCDILS